MSQMYAVYSWIPRQDQHIEEMTRILVKNSTHGAKWAIQDNNYARTLVCDSAEAARDINAQIEGAIAIWQAVHYATSPEMECGPSNRLMRLLKGNLGGEYPDTKPYDESEQEGPGELKEGWR